MTSDNPIRIMCVDDNELVAEGMKRRLAFESRFKWVGWISETCRLTELIQSACPDILLVDVDMPGKDTFIIVRELAQECPHVRAVMFSGHVRSEYIDRAIDAGAWGYVSKNISVDELLRAIEQVASGEFVLSAEAATEHLGRRR